jgi:hypothetical protein
MSLSDMMVSAFSRVTVAEIPNGTPRAARRSIASWVLRKTPAPRRASVSFSHPSTEMAGVMFPKSAMRRAASSSIRVALVYIMK